MAKTMVLDFRQQHNPDILLEHFDAEESGRGGSVWLKLSATL